MHDEVGGNGNGIPEPGESVTIDLALLNEGSATAEDVWAVLAGGPYLEIDPTPVAYGDLPPDAAVV